MNRAGILALVAAGVVATGVGTYGYLGRPPTSPSKAGCDLTMTPHHTLTKGVSGTTQSLAFVSRACATGTVTVAHGGVTQGTCSLSSGSCTYSDTLPDMATTTVTGSITLNGVTHTDSLVATMDSANPEISLSSPALAGDGSLVVVSGVIDPTGIPLNLHLEANDPGFYADALPGTDGGGHVTVTAVVLGGSDGGSLVTAWQGTQLAATALTVTPQTVTQSITLPEGAVGVLTLTASIGSGSTALAIPVEVDTLVPPTPVSYYGIPVATDGGCAPCCADGTCSSLDAPATAALGFPGMVCTAGCLYRIPPGQDGGWGGYLHVVDQRHGDFELAAIVPPDSGPLWGNATTGQPEVQWTCISQLQATESVTDAVTYMDGGLPFLAFPDGGVDTDVDVKFVAQWMCSHHDGGCDVRWTP